MAALAATGMLAAPAAVAVATTSGLQVAVSAQAVSKAGAMKADFGRSASAAGQIHGPETCRRPAATPPRGGRGAGMGAGVAHQTRPHLQNKTLQQNAALFAYCSLNLRQII